MPQHPKKNRATTLKKKEGRRGQAGPGGEPVELTIGRSVVPNSAFAPRLVCNMPWHYNSGISAPAGGTSGYVAYRLNGPYDPDVGAGGGQPRGFDQLALIYGRYRVVEASVRLRFYDPTSTGSLVGYRVRRGTDTNSTGWTYEQFMAQPFVELVHLSTTGARHVELNFKIKPATIWGQDAIQQHTADDYAALTTTVPVNEVYVDVVAMNPTVGAMSNYMLLDVVYRVEWSALRLLNDA